MSICSPSRSWRSYLYTTAVGVIALTLSGCGLQQFQGGSPSGATVVTPAPPTTPTTPGTPATPAIIQRSFGLHIHDPFNHWPSVPFQFWRLWDASVDWTRVEPSRGVYDFSRLDKYVELAEKHHVQLIYVFGNTPAWAARDPNAPCNEGIPGASSPLIDIQDWQDFVTALVTRYQGRIQAYEVWNEANLTGYWTGTMDEMLQMVRIAYTTIKQIDPGATVLAPSITAESGMKWLAQFLQIGGANYSDVLAYHLYSRNPSPEALISYYQKVLELGGVWGKEVWNTEGGWGPWGTFNDIQQASFLARMIIMQSAVGYTHIAWYAWDDRNGWVHVYLVQPDLKTPTLAGQAFGEVQSWLKDSSLSCVSQSGTWQCTATGANGTLRYILWNPLSAQTFVIPPDWKVSQTRDLTGTRTPIAAGQVQIGSLPVLLEP